MTTTIANAATKAPCSNPAAAPAAAAQGQNPVQQVGRIRCKSASSAAVPKPDQTIAAPRCYLWSYRSRVVNAGGP